MAKPPQELRLNVTYFYQDEESRNLLTIEEATTSLGCDIEDEPDEFYMRGEKVYECWIGRTLCRMSRSSLLALSLFCTLAVAVVMITVVLLCTFVSLSSDNKDAEARDEVVGVINWLHYPIGDLTLRRLNHTHPHHMVPRNITRLFRLNHSLNKH